MIEPLSHDERRALREIVDNLDLIHAGGRAFLFAEVSPETLDTLACFEAEGDGHESG